MAQAPAMAPLSTGAPQQATGPAAEPIINYNGAFQVVLRSQVQRILCHSYTSGQYMLSFPSMRGYLVQAELISVASSHSTPPSYFTWHCSWSLSRE